MLNYILAGVIRILIWQLFVFLFYWLSGTDEDKTSAMAMGIFAGIFIIVGGIIEIIRLEWCKNNLVAFQIKNRFELSYTTKNVKASLKCDSQNRVKSCNSDVMYIQFFDRPIKSFPCKSEIWKGEERFKDLDMTQFMKSE